MYDGDNGTPDWRVIADQNRRPPARISWPRRTGPTSKYLVGGVAAILAFGYLSVSDNSPKDKPAEISVPAGSGYSELMELYRRGQVRIALYDPTNPGWVIDPLQADPRDMRRYIDETAARRQSMTIKLSSPAPGGGRCEMKVDAGRFTAMVDEMKQLPRAGGRIDYHALVDYCKRHANKQLGSITLDSGFVPWLAHYQSRPHSWTAQVDLARAEKSAEPELG